MLCTSHRCINFSCLAFLHVKWIANIFQCKLKHVNFYLNKYKKHNSYKWIGGNNIPSNNSQVIKWVYIFCFPEPTTATTKPPISSASGFIKSCLYISISFKFLVIFHTPLNVWWFTLTIIFIKKKRRKNTFIAIVVVILGESKIICHSPQR